MIPPCGSCILASESGSGSITVSWLQPALFLLLRAGMLRVVWLWPLVSLTLAQGRSQVHCRTEPPPGPDVRLLDQL